MEAPQAPATVADRYRVLLEIARTLTGTLEHEDLYRSIYHETAKVIEAAGFYVALYDQAKDLATVVFYADVDQEQRVEITYRGSDSAVIRTGEASIVEDELQMRSLLVIGEEQSDITRSAISAPLRYKGRVIGAISTQSYEPNAYGEDELELLQGIADIAAVAIENAHRVAELENRRIEAERVEEIGGAIASSLEVDSVLGKIIEAAQELLDADGATVWLLDDYREGTVRIGATTTKALEGLGPFKMKGPLLSQMVDARRPVLVEDVLENENVPPEVRGKIRSTRGILVPLQDEDKIIGALSVGLREAHDFTTEDTLLLQRLASHASVALSNARLHESIQALSLTDPLTGLPNRRHFRMHLSREFAAAERGRHLAVVIFDVDDFKSYNDSMGHVAGDEALVTLAQVLRHETRAMNLVARFGGDEFISVLSDSSLEGALLHAQRVAEHLTGKVLKGDRRLTVSFGIAIHDESMKTIEDLIHAADQDMYRSKGNR